MISITNSSKELENIIKKELEDLGKKYIESGSLKKNKNMVFTCLSKYILFSPALNTSLYAVKYSSLGLKQPHDYKKFINRIKQELSIKKNSYYYLGSNRITDEIYKNFKDHIKRKDIFFAFRVNSEFNTQLDSMIKSIRNGFAHGNFIMIDRTFIIWNIDKKIIKALIVISSYKLEKLIKLFTPANHTVL